ncbi:MAG: hypothetical protein JWM27_2430 [Gemmatimonadetes bacterium]|nr:hypothetical protein [Gemmatimonadota bacterium]
MDSAGLFVMAVAAAVLGALVTAGVPAQLAPRDWLWVAGFVSMAAVSGVLLYRSALRGWVEQRHHPSVLRLASAAFALNVFVGSFSWRFRDVPTRLELPLPVGSGPVALWFWLIVTLLLAAGVYLAERRHTELR